MLAAFKRLWLALVKPVGSECQVCHNTGMICSSDATLEFADYIACPACMSQGELG